MTVGDLFLELNRVQTHLDTIKTMFRTREDTRDLLHEACIGKKGYRTPELAGIGAAKAKASGSTDELRVYACPFCGSYHLTKRTLEEIAGVRR